MKPLLLALLFFVSTAACAQTPEAAPAAERTEAEQQVHDRVATDGVHVVHFWATWCHNSRNELRDGVWNALVEANPDVSFTFVTVWSDGRSGRDRLRDFGVPDRVAEVVAQDDAPGADRRTRRRTFLGLPVTWTPTTWVFHRNGQLAYAFNYGEVDAARLQSALDDARADWSH